VDERVERGFEKILQDLGMHGSGPLLLSLFSQFSKHGRGWGNAGCGAG
jgi:hypothetical protein